MKLNLDSLKSDILSYLKDNGFITFHAFSRSLDGMPEVDWDTRRYPDFKEFLSVAKELDTRLIVFHHREFASDIIDRAIDDLGSSGFDYEDQRVYEQRLRELSVYEGFTCLIELSFDYEDTLYLFELRTEWFTELTQILDQLTISDDDSDDGPETDPLGGYYSKN
jgi:hypothetical protein